MTRALMMQRVVRVKRILFAILMVVEFVFKFPNTIVAAQPTFNINLKIEGISDTNIKKCSLMLIESRDGNYINAIFNYRLSLDRSIDAKIINGNFDPNSISIRVDGITLAKTIINKWDVVGQSSRDCSNLGLYDSFFFVLSEKVRDLTIELPLYIDIADTQGYRMCLSSPISDGIVFTTRLSKSKNINGDNYAGVLSIDKSVFKVPYNGAASQSPSSTKSVVIRFHSLTDRNQYSIFDVRNLVYGGVITGIILLIFYRRIYRKLSKGRRRQGEQKGTECAGINRFEVENERVLQRKFSQLLWPCLEGRVR